VVNIISLEEAVAETVTQTLVIQQAVAVLAVQEMVLSQEMVHLLQTLEEQTQVVAAVAVTI
tara:strand:+ start:355 stop:537 length:183 start_codon:yes stop_codon:yes gene_type:complete